MATKVSVIYDSATGTTYRQALAIKEGAEVRLRKVRELAPEKAIASNEGWSRHRLETRDVPEAELDDLEWADAVIFGTPTRFGLPSAQIKRFIDTTGGLWAQGKLANKVVSGFGSAATAHGGQETTIVALNNVVYHWGGIIVAPGYLDPIQFQTGNPYGASHTSDNGEPLPDEAALASVRFQGRRVAEVAAKLAGVPELVAAD